ncbi:MAG: type I restriction endonuclease subunit S, partial [Bacilli bacterium]|nr:type I restriction endonuclease subunit S [Bacilli bacterium]
SKFKGATVERRNPISENDLMNTPLNLPKMEEQIKFSLICQQIDKSKFIIQKQIKLLEELLEKKMNEYFGD